MQREIHELCGRKVWAPSDIPRGRKITRSRWVYTVKYRADGTVDRFKARFVACGYSQVPGVDYDKSFSSTMRATTFRSLVSLAAVHGLQADHADISNAYCQADMRGSDVYIQPPRGYEGLCNTDQGLKLQRALYGCAQSGYLWQQTLCKFLLSIGFKRLQSDACVFVKHTNGRPIIIGCYVDDVAIFHDPKTKMLDQFLDALLQARGGRFDGKHLGKLEWFLGIKVTRYASGDYSLNQSKYIGDLLDRFIPNSDTIAFARRIPYPTEKFKSLAGATSDIEVERVKRLPYLQLVGAMLYLATMCRPDLLFHMSVLCSYMSNPSMACYEAAQSLLLYVGKTRHLEIHYSKNWKVPSALAGDISILADKYGVHALSDSSWTAPKSVCGYVVYMAGGPIAFSSRKLNVIADSTALAEYSAGSSCAKEITFVRNLCNELGFVIPGPIVLALDNQASIKIAEDNGAGKLTKHFDFAVHRLRDDVECMRIKLTFVNTHDQTADIFTKALDEEAYLRHRGSMLKDMR